MVSTGVPAYRLTNPWMATDPSSGQLDAASAPEPASPTISVWSNGPAVWASVANPR